MIFDTFGSDFDTVLSLHYGGCPGTTANLIDCSDDSQGTLQSEIIRYLNSGPIWVRVAGYAGSTGNVQLNVGPTASISGTVTGVGSSGHPLVYIEVFDEEGQRVKSDTSYQGTYIVRGLRPGTYYLKATSNDYLDQLWDGVPCVGECDPTAGTPVTVTHGAEATADFVMQEAGTIAGFVTEQDSGDPITALVRIYDASGVQVKGKYSDGSGHYEINGLDSGTHYATAESSFHVREIWDDIPCIGSCKPRSGTPIEVVPGEIEDVDFDLRLGGAVAGVVTEDPGGSPLSGARVFLYREDGFSSTLALGDDSGAYEFRGLQPGTYFVKAERSSFVDELYDDIPCNGYCDITSGTPVVATLGTTATVDFTLQRAGSISGTVLEELTGRPLQGVSVSVFDSAGLGRGYDRTDDLGNYEVNELSATGNYYAIARADYHIDELFDDTYCPGSCDPVNGTPIPVTLGAETSGIDFALTFGGGISGVVTESVASLPVLVSVYVWDADGNLQERSGSGLLGGYEAGGLLAGTYFVTTENEVGYLDELFDDLPCFGGCDPTAGTPVAVTLAATSSGIDFALDLGGSVAGTRTDAATGAEVRSRVRVFDASGSEVGDYFGLSGPYSVDGLPTGTYFATSDVAPGYHNELYDNLPCSSCDPTLGSPIAVTAGVATNVDFALCGPAMLEVLFPPDPDPDSSIDGCTVQIDGEAAPYHPSCPALDRIEWCWGDGLCDDQTLPATHTYAPNGGLASVEVRAEDQWGFVTHRTDELNLWDCLAAGACGYPESRTLSGLTFDSPTAVEACSTIRVGPDFEVELPGSLLLRAGELVEFGNGTVIGQGCEMTVEIDSDLLP